MQEKKVWVFPSAAVFHPKKSARKSYVIALISYQIGGHGDMDDMDHPHRFQSGPTPGPAGKCVFGLFFGHVRRPSGLAGMAGFFLFSCPAAGMGNLINSGGRVCPRSGPRVFA